ncbi:MAG: histidine kinase dimerization/phosphoacceptor domain -containing protein [Bacteroidales bacterium]
MNNKQRFGFYVMAITWPLAVFLGFLPDLVFSFQALTPVTPILHLASLPLAGMVFYLLIITNVHTDRWNEIAVLFFEKIRQFVFFVDHAGKITSANRFSEKILHYSAGELIGKDLDYLFQDSEFIRKQLSAAQKDKTTQSGVYFLITKKRTAIPVRISVLKIHDKAGNVAGFVLTGFDYRSKMELCKQIRERMHIDFELAQKRNELEASIASRKKELEYANVSLQREIQKSDTLERKKLKELETKKKIIREIHHRVKNNMQMVVSLVNLMHSQKMLCAECRPIFRDMSLRVRDIAVLQEYMYESPYITRIHFSSFMAKMTNELKSKFTAQEHVSIHLLMADDEISIEHAIPCGIIIYELLSNSLKYAFPPSMVNSRRSVARSFVNVAFSWAENGYSLTVEDNGIGIPLHHDQPLYKQVGLQMVDVLVNDYIHGEIYYNNQEGTRVTIFFKGMTNHKYPLYHESGIVD